VLYSIKKKLWILVDFGLSVEATSKGARTTQYSRGAACYRAPELLQDHAKYTTRVDMWAFGCLLHELLTHTPPFRTDFDVLDYYSGAAQTFPAIRFESIPSFWGKHMSALISDLLHRHPRERPGASEVVDVFSLILYALGCRIDWTLAARPSNASWSWKDFSQSMIDNFPNDAELLLAEYWEHHQKAGDAKKWREKWSVPPPSKSSNKPIRRVHDVQHPSEWALPIPYDQEPLPMNPPEGLRRETSPARFNQPARQMQGPRDPSTHRSQSRGSSRGKHSSSPEGSKRDVGDHHLSAATSPNGQMQFPDNPSQWEDREQYLQNNQFNQQPNQARRAIGRGSNRSRNGYSPINYLPSVSSTPATPFPRILSFHVSSAYADRISHEPPRTLCTILSTQRQVSISSAGVPSMVDARLFSTGSSAHACH